MSSEDALESPTPTEGVSEEQGGITLEQLQADFAANYGKEDSTEDAQAEVAPEPEQAPAPPAPDPVASLSAKIADLEARLAAATPPPPAPDLEAEISKDERVVELDKILTEVPQQIQTLVQTRDETAAAWAQARDLQLKLEGKLEAADETDKPDIKAQLHQVMSRAEQLKFNWTALATQISTAHSAIPGLRNERARLAEALKSEFARQTQEQAEAEADAKQANESLVHAVQTACAKATLGQSNIVLAYTRASVAAEIRRVGRTFTVDEVAALSKRFAEQGAKELGVRAEAARAKLEVAPQRSPVPVGSSRPTQPKMDAAFFMKQADATIRAYESGTLRRS